MRIKSFRRYPVNGQKWRSPWHLRPLAKAFGVSSRHPVASRRRMAKAARREAKQGQTTKASWSYEQSKACFASALRCSSKTIDIPASLSSQPLEAWQISVRLTGVLQRSGVRVLGDLHGRKVGDFALKRNCGLKTLIELDSLASAVHRTVKSAAGGAAEAVSGGGKRCAGGGRDSSVDQRRGDGVTQQRVVPHALSGSSVSGSCRCPGASLTRRAAFSSPSARRLRTSPPRQALVPIRPSECCARSSLSMRGL